MAAAIKCAGGDSGPLPGMPGKMTVAGGFITAGLELLSPLLTPLAVLVDAFIIDVLASCQSDPPPMPTLDACDLETVAVGMLSPCYQTTLTKLHNIVLNYAWDKFCGCLSGPVIAPAAPTQNPPGAGAATGSPNAPCFEGNYDMTPTWRAPGGNLSKFDNVTKALLPTTTDQLTLSDTGGSFVVYGRPPNTTNISWQARGSGQVLCSSGNTVNTHIVTYTSAGAPVDHFQVTEGNNTNDYRASGTRPINQTGTYWGAFLASPNVTGPCGPLINSVQMTMQVFCGAAPGSLLNCCPPDPGLMMGLQEILRRIDALDGGGGLPRLPTYSPGVTHAGLSGTGSITITGKPVAFRVDIVNPPAGWPNNPGNPAYYFSLGFVTSYAEDSPIKGWRLVYLSQSFPLAAVCNRIGWTLSQGITVNITELLEA